MPSFRTAEVVEILEERSGLQRVRVQFDDPSLPGDRAYCLTRVLGEVSVGDRVVLNTTAVELGLGTGGWHVVHWNLSRDHLERPGPDHVMKLRYTSLQIDAGTDELAAGHLPETLERAPVVACTVHSQLPLVAATIKHLRPSAIVGYVMTDGAALPIALSDIVHDLRDRGLIDVTVTAGHAFGADMESVTVASGMLLARHQGRADVIIVAMGPGVVGTGTTYGTTTIEAAAVLDMVVALEGRPILCVRASDGDGRDRHRGISHHTATVASLTGSTPWVAAVPPEAADLPGVRSHEVSVPEPADVLGGHSLHVTTMGRTMGDDPLFFRAAVAAGAVAVDLIDAP